ncbi:MAG: gamma-glutamylcyclotransferase family protein [Pseudomonadota bacterium]
MTEIAFTADHRLATYGTLAPGRPNYAQVEPIGGTWRTGHVRGRLIDAGWGANVGYPGMIADQDGDPIAVHILEAVALPDHWARLDAFEGPGYRRITVPATLEDGSIIDVSIYEALPSES